MGWFFSARRPRLAFKEEAMSARSIRFFVLGLGLVALQAAAQPVPYTFSSGPSTFSMVPELLGTSVSGSFLYDATAPLTSFAAGAQSTAACRQSKSYVC